jgi:hypothetical protein
MIGPAALSRTMAEWLAASMVMAGFYQIAEAYASHIRVRRK